MASFQPRRGASGMLIVGGLTVAALLVGGVYYVSNLGSGDAKDKPITFEVLRGRFDHVVLEQGEVESSSNVDIVCQVKSRNGAGTAILWVIDEGTAVKPGDRLVELDSSALEQELQTQRNIVTASLANKISAASALEQAEVAREEYLDGTFTQEERTIQSEILLANEKLSRSQETSAYSERLAALGFQSPQQLRADQFAVQQAQMELELSQGRLDTLQDITKRKMLIGFDADIETARARLEAETRIYAEEVERQTEIEQQIENCIIIAQQDGVVVHANQMSSRGGSEFVVEAGAMVREQQAIIRLPDPTRMQVKAKINESRVPYVLEGMPVLIEIGAFQGQELQGRVIKVNKYAEPTSWFSSAVKEYATFVQILDPAATIRSGMTAEVRIFVERLPDALQMPVQALFEYRGRMFVLIERAPQQYETREVVIGSSNDKMVTIEDGVSEGDRVVLNPRGHAKLMELPDIPEVTTTDVPESLAGMPPAAGTAPATGEGGAPEESGGAPGGGGGRGGNINAAEIVSQTMTEFDTDSSGSLSTDEISTMPEFRQATANAADSDGDGEVSQAELMQATQAFIQRMRQQGGGEGGGRRGAGGPGGPR